MRWVLFSLILLHAIIHAIGFAKAFGLGHFPQLTHAISKPMGILWLVAGVVLLVADAMLVAHPRGWWAVGLAGVVLSQVVIITAWSDARLGTVANGLIALGVGYAFVSDGPRSFRATFDRGTRRQLAAMPVAPARVVGETDLAALPEPVACYLRRAGVVGQPWPTHFRATWRGRIRGAAGDPWMPFTAEQCTFVAPAVRYFHMKASRRGLPVDVLHVFQAGQATMDVKLASLIPMVLGRGDALSRAETVTMLNDLSIVAPAGLLQDAVSWEPIDATSARAAYAVGGNAVHAVLKFDAQCDLVDFVSDDRGAASADGKSMTPQRWSTPVRETRAFGPYRVGGRAEAWWHPPQGEFAYLEIELLALAINGGCG